MTEPSKFSDALKLSIVITCYNYEDYVGFAIESALAQTRPADEIIVVDDGSTDNSDNVIAKYAGKIRPVYQSNAGTIAAFERGYAESSGDVVLFLDADDRLLPRAIEAVVSSWNERASKVQYNLEVIDAEGASTGRYFCTFPKSYTPSDILSEFIRTGTYAWPVTSGNAYSRKFLQQVMPMKPAVSYDGVLNTVAPLYGDIITIADPLGQYRLHGKNISRHDKHGRAQRFPDFARQIGFRTKEFEILRAHCAQRHFKLPDCNLLDNELVFVNYRLAALRLGQQYVGSENDTALNLWRRGLSLSFAGGNGCRTALSHALWLTTLFALPPWLARKLLLLRFNRAEITKPFRDFRRAVLNRLTRP
jgi:glycosyltransferase involved in cell wall biosynthesis